MMIAGMASGCPLHNLVPETNDLVYRGKWKQAYDRLAKTHSFPEFTSRVCPALCEAACTCNVNGEPVATKENERAIIEMAWEEGGLLRYGIPNMKLDKSVIDRRVKLMEVEGVVFRTGVDVGKDRKASQIRKDFDRVVLACGASNPRDISVPGREAGNIYFAVDFLTSVTKSLLDSNFEDKQYISPKGKDVLVIGGGDTGNDCVGTAIRLGASGTAGTDCRRFSGQSEICHRCLWNRLKSQNQCADKAGGIRNQCTGGIRGRRYAQRPVSGGMGHCRGAKGSRGCGQVFDGQQFLRHKRTRQGGQIHATQS